jgi:hypothetical protein
MVTIFIITRLKCLNKTLSPSNTCLMHDYYFKSIYTSFMRKSAYISGSLLSIYVDYNIYSIYKVSPFQVYKIYYYTLGQRISGQPYI